VTVIAAPPISIYNFTPDEGGKGSQTKVGIVIVNMTTPTGGFGATSPIRVETRLNEDPSLVSVPGKGGEFAAVSLIFDAASVPEARAWQKMFEGAATRNGYDRYVAETVGTSAQIDILGPSALDDDSTNDVLLEALVADYTLSLENVPTLVE
jgi:hypothetical protein